LPTIRIETNRIDEITAAVSAGLTAYNDRFLPKKRDRTPVAISLRDDAGRLAGGLIGELRLDWPYISLLWIDESLRGTGQGKALLAEAERVARDAGCTHMHLFTWSFQSPDFYRAMGFVEMGRMSDHPSGHDTLFFVKWLQ
jgi:GNAT superfamily N-acetyltransferase